MIGKIYLHFSERDVLLPLPPRPRPSAYLSLSFSFSLHDLEQCLHLPLHSLTVSFRLGDALLTIDA